VARRRAGDDPARRPESPCRPLLDLARYNVTYAAQARLAVAGRLTRRHEGAADGRAPSAIVTNVKCLPIASRSRILATIDS